MNYSNFQMQEIQSQSLPVAQQSYQEMEEEELFEMPKAPKLRAQHAPVDYMPLSLP